MHAGAPSRQASSRRERLFIKWLEQRAPEAAAFYLLGDLWDFWFEYRRAVPKGHVRLLGALAALTDSGITVFFQRGNHDRWLTSYLSEEIGLRILPDPFEATWQEKVFFLSHGHHLGPLSWKDRVSYALMESSFLTFLYRWIHPDIGLYLGRFFSGRSREIHAPLDGVDLGEKELFRRFVQQAYKDNKAVDWYILGHRHLALVERIHRSQVVLLGDWIQHYTYLRLDSKGWILARFSEGGDIVLASGDGYSEKSKGGEESAELVSSHI
ncbi:MAG: UDP-2,3-diacylglucosamine diphosphatase [Bacteroidia bacterium]|nr:UDP-2,3-diacylglucosamine diphosphatase [Bacteroidia bacterium]